MTQGQPAPSAPAGAATGPGDGPDPAADAAAGRAGEGRRFASATAPAMTRLFGTSLGSRMIAGSTGSHPRGLPRRPVRGARLWPGHHGDRPVRARRGTPEGRPGLELCLI